jgi:hypothetical protein
VEAVTIPYGLFQDPSQVGPSDEPGGGYGPGQITSPPGQDPLYNQLPAVPDHATAGQPVAARPSLYERMMKGLFHVPSAYAGLLSPEDEQYMRGQATLALGASLLGAGNPPGTHAAFAPSLAKGLTDMNSTWMQGLNQGVAQVNYGQGLQHSLKQDEVAKQINAQYPEVPNETPPQAMQRYDKIAGAWLNAGYPEIGHQYAYLARDLREGRAGAQSALRRFTPIAGGVLDTHTGQVVATKYGEAQIQLAQSRIDATYQTLKQRGQIAAANFYKAQVDLKMKPQLAEETDPNTGEVTSMAGFYAGAPDPEEAERQAREATIQAFPEAKGLFGLKKASEADVAAMVTATPRLEGESNKDYAKRIRRGLTAKGLSYPGE